MAVINDNVALSVYNSVGALVRTLSTSSEVCLVDHSSCVCAERIPVFFFRKGVNAFLGLCKNQGTAIFASYVNGPLERRLISVDVSGANRVVLTPEPGWCDPRVRLPGF